jgi:hypothetical protein
MKTQRRTEKHETQPELLSYTEHPSHAGRIEAVMAGTCWESFGVARKLLPSISFSNTRPSPFALQLAAQDSTGERLAIEMVDLFAENPHKLLRGIRLPHAHHVNRSQDPLSGNPSLAAGTPGRELQETGLCDAQVVGAQTWHHFSYVAHR